MTIDLNAWSLTLALLCWIYVVVASFWHHVFDPGVVLHGLPEENGYRVGTAIHWRLPPAGFYFMVGLGFLAVAAVAILPEWLTRWMLALETATVALIWLVAPPGQRLRMGEPQDSDDVLVEALVERKPVRALAVFILFGLLPAALLGWVIERLLS